MAADRTQDRFDVLAPRDLVITLRSIDRRFGSIRSRATTARLSDVVDRPGPSGEAIDTIVTEAARGAALVTSALDTALDSNEPVIAAAVIDPSERAFTDDRGWSVEAGVDTLVVEATRAADRLDDASADALSRPVTVTGAGATTALAIGQQLARELIGALTISERHVDWLESQV